MPKIVDRNKMRSEIAKRAIEILAKKGFQTTTIQEIADAAGLGKGTIYHYFKTKEEILLAVSEELFRETERSLGAALLRIDSPVDRLAALIEESMHVTADLENVFIVYTDLWLMNLHNESDNDFMDVIKKMHKDVADIVARMIEEGKKQGLWLQDTDAGALASYLVASFDGVIAHYLIDRENFDLKRVTKEFIRFLLQQGAPKNEHAKQ